MTSVTPEQVTSSLPELLSRVQRGETLLIVRNGSPVGQIAPVPRSLRPIADRIGLLAGEATVPADWKALGRTEIEAEFYEQ